MSRRVPPELDPVDGDADDDPDEEELDEDELEVEYFVDVVSVDSVVTSVPNSVQSPQSSSSAPSTLVVVREAFSAPHISHWGIRRGSGPAGIKHAHPVPSAGSGSADVKRPVRLLPHMSEASEVLTTMEPDPAWDAAAHEAVVATLGAADYDVRIWGADWCGDCRRLLPAFAAALRAAGIPEERVHVYPVERGDDGKTGPLVPEYGIERIPTVVVERDGDELARFVEDADVPIATALAEELSDDTV